jgi:hypothetical protein
MALYCTWQEIMCNNENGIAVMTMHLHEQRQAAILFTEFYLWDRKNSAETYTMLRTLGCMSVIVGLPV